MSPPSRGTLTRRPLFRRRLGEGAGPPITRIWRRALPITDCSVGVASHAGIGDRRSTHTPSSPLFPPPARPRCHTQPTIAHSSTQDVCRALPYLPVRFDSSRMLKQVSCKEILAELQNIILEGKPNGGIIRDDLRRTKSSHTVVTSLGGWDTI